MGTPILPNDEITQGTVMKKAPPPPFERAGGEMPRHSPTLRRPCFFSHSIKLFGLLLSAVTVSLPYLPRCLRSTVTGGKAPIAAT